VARYAMTIDTRTCLGCTSCMVACKVENQVDEPFFRNRLVQQVSGDFPNLRLVNIRENCNMCSDAPCVENCPTGASHFEPKWGLVEIEESLCTGCKACIAACPYDARFINRRGYAEKCTFCLPRLKQGLDPACVATCPSQAIAVGDLDDPSSTVASLVATRKHWTLNPEAGTGPNVFYLE
jgi:Fe-S-cluster-containing dehydrogenase component